MPKTFMQLKTCFLAEAIPISQCLTEYVADLMEEIGTASQGTMSHADV